MDTTDTGGERMSVQRRAADTEETTSAAGRGRLLLQRPHLRGRTNVGRMERALSLLGGGALALYGMRRRGAPGTLAGLASAILLQRGTTGHCLLYESLGVDTTERTRNGLVRQHGRAAVLEAANAIRVEHTVMVSRPRAELYRYWRTLENLPRIMRHLEAVTVLDERRSRWRAKAPAGQSVEWTAIIHNEVENELIAWKSLDDASVPNAGSVLFADAPGGTEIRVLLEYDPPAGRLGMAVAKLFGEEPDIQVREDLQRFKTGMESGAGDRATTQPSAHA